MDIAIFQIVILIMSAIIHEYMHGWMADRLGDSTARLSGRLTLNPLPHIDPLGSIVVPGILLLSGAGFVFGWAKPVPFNPYNLKDAKYGPAKVAAAGPMANLVVALFFGLWLRFFPVGGPQMSLFFQLIVFINILLMVFNSVPIPPLDGSKMVLPFLPYSWQVKLLGLERYGMFLVLIFVMIGFPLIIPIIDFIFKLIVGL